MLGGNQGILGLACFCGAFIPRVEGPPLQLNIPPRQQPWEKEHASPQGPVGNPKAHSHWPTWCHVLTPEPITVRYCALTGQSQVLCLHPAGGVVGSAGGSLHQDRNLQIESGGGVHPRGTLSGRLNAGQGKSADGLFAGPNLGQEWGSVFLHREGSWAGTAPPAQGQSQSSVTRLQAHPQATTYRAFCLWHGDGGGVSSAFLPSVSKLLLPLKEDCILTTIN